MTTVDTEPRCAACGARLIGHDLASPRCEHFVWPDTLEAAAIELHRIAADLWREMTRPIAWLLDRLVRLLDWLARR